MVKIAQANIVKNVNKEVEDKQHAFISTRELLIQEAINSSNKSEWEETIESIMQFKKNKI